MNLQRTAAGLIGALWLSACSVLVDTNSIVIKCDVTPGRETDDPCLPAGMHCVANECKACKGAVEICNGIDDDCDGIVDEGQDEDGDGFTWCGGGIAQLADCAPNDPTIHPASPPGPDGAGIAAPPELCDGKDNDCDGKVDEAPECATMHSCVKDGCPSGQTCDVTSGTCIVPRPVGSGCRSDAECAGGFCVMPGDFGLTIDLQDNRCATACCTDADCSSGSVCLQSDSGARLCLPASIVARPAGAMGDRCSQDSDCASGLCSLGRCAQRCLSDAECRSSGDVCTLSSGSINEPRVWVCGDPAGRSSAGNLCSAFDPTACRSGYCTDFGTCGQACGRDTDCGSDQVCGFSMARPILLGPTSIVPACEPRASAGESQTLCCTSADCSLGELCAPQSSEAKLWVMACQHD